MERCGGEVFFQRNLLPGVTATKTIGSPKPAPQAVGTRAGGAEPRWGSLLTLEGAVAATVGGVTFSVVVVFLRPEIRIRFKGHVNCASPPLRPKFSRELYFRPFGYLSSTMAVGKNKRLTKGGKKGAKKKV